MPHHDHVVRTSDVLPAAFGIDEDVDTLAFGAGPGLLGDEGPDEDDVGGAEASRDALGQPNVTQTCRVERREPAKGRGGLAPERRAGRARGGAELLGQERSLGSSMACRRPVAGPAHSRGVAAALTKHSCSRHVQPMLHREQVTEASPLTSRGAPH